VPLRHDVRWQHFVSPEQNTMLETQETSLLWNWVRHSVSSVQAAWQNDSPG
jgi:hypothetical protein